MSGMRDGVPDPGVPGHAPDAGVPYGAPGPGVPDGARDPVILPGTSATSPSGAADAAGAATQASRARRRRLLRTALLLVVPLALLLGFIAFLRVAIDPAAPILGQTDGIVVLTGGSERVTTGFRLLSEGQARLLLISGAHPEASLAEIATAAGIDAAPFAGRVAVGRAAASTRGNAAEAAAWARAEELRSLRIVTAGYHMPRAMLELRRAMPGLQLVAHPVPSAALRAPGALWRPQLWALLAGEYARYLGAWAGLSGSFVPRRESQGT
ncbi:YdcF family protein [Roseomonas rosulenta]|uniref:YdcF family protein n=1 Tax=Roseomonas rosulenta TaxID=2748667 RepID=UPI0018DF7BF3|nr:YdcF family protein [Roseomonas rosulenta]